MNQRLRVLMVVEQCNPEWPSVPWVAYKFFEGATRFANVTLVTHERNRPAFEKRRFPATIHFIKEPAFIRKYYALIHKLTASGSVNWPLLHVLSYPAYEAFNRSVLKRFGPDVENGAYDVVHALTPMMPRYPYAIAAACTKTPFVLGPVNGGVPFPPGFRDVGLKEHARFNVLRPLARLLPGYRRSYTRATTILAGSAYTRDMVASMFRLPQDKLVLFAENGVEEEFFRPRSQPRDGDVFSLLFVGRLVPYKGADMVIEAMARLPESLRTRTRLTLAGDGSERDSLTALANRTGLTGQIRFTGQIPHAELAELYASADLFCFPSVREFGGAVVLEAMAAGVPPLVVDNGGIGEYVTAECGVKIAPLSREHVVASLADHLSRLLPAPELRATLSEAARSRAREFTWDAKAQFMQNIYEQAVRSRQHRP